MFECFLFPYFTCDLLDVLAKSGRYFGSERDVPFDFVQGDISCRTTGVMPFDITQCDVVVKPTQMLLYI